MAATRQVLTDFQAVLAGLSALVALVGARIVAGVPPQGAALPTVSLNVIAGAVEYTHDGGDQDETLVQIDIDAHTPTECRNVADAIRAGISGKSIDQGSTIFEAIFHDGTEFTATNDSLVGGTTQDHRLTVVYQLLHRPA